MPGLDANFIIVLWGVTILVLAWTWIPALIAALGGTRYLCGGVNEPENLEPTENEPDYAYWVFQLQEMGYEPLGKGWVRVDFAGHEWSLYTVLRVFYHKQHQIFAVLQRVPAPFYFWPGASFVTCFTDGRLLFTDNNEAVSPFPDDDFIRQGVVSLDLAHVEEFHLATTEALRGKGLRPDKEASMDTLIHAMQTHVGPEVRRHHARNGTQYIFAHSLIHVCVSAPAVLATNMNLTHWSLPLTNLVLGLILLLGESAQKRQYARMVRAAMRQKQREQMAKAQNAIPPA